MLFVIVTIWRDFGALWHDGIVGYRKMFVLKGGVFFLWVLSLSLHFSLFIPLSSCSVHKVDRAADSCSQQAHSRLSHSRIMKPLWPCPNSSPGAAIQKNTALCLEPCPAAMFSEATNSSAELQGCWCWMSLQRLDAGEREGVALVKLYMQSCLCNNVSPLASVPRLSVP